MKHPKAPRGQRKEIYMLQEVLHENIPRLRQLI